MSLGRPKIVALLKRKSGATLADIEQMIDDAANTETIDEIFIVGGTHETTSDVSA